MVLRLPGRNTWRSQNHNKLSVCHAFATDRALIAMQRWGLWFVMILRPQGFAFSGRSQNHNKLKVVLRFCDRQVAKAGGPKIITNSKCVMRLRPPGRKNWRSQNHKKLKVV